MIRWPQYGAVPDKRHPIEDFGAIPNGIKDCAPAFRAAYRYAAAGRVKRIGLCLIGHGPRKWSWRLP